MAVNGAQIGVAGFCGTQQSCIDQYGCVPGVCPDFTIKRHDTKPGFKVKIEDCEGALDLSDQNLVVEVNIWANAKLKFDILTTDTVISFADKIGFNQCMAGDIIIADRVRSPELMLITGFDEVNFTVTVRRGFNATPISAWKKATPLRIMRTTAAPAQIVLQLSDVQQEDGTIKKDQLVGSFFEYIWSANDTCLPGCYWLEFKLLRMTSAGTILPVTPNTSSYDADDADIITSTTLISLTSTLSPQDLLKNLDISSLAISLTPSNMFSFTPSNTFSFSPSTVADEYECSSGPGVDWVRRFPEASQGFLIKIVDTPTLDM